MQTHGPFFWPSGLRERFLFSFFLAVSFISPLVYTSIFSFYFFSFYTCLEFLFLFFVAKNIEHKNENHRSLNPYPSLQKIIIPQPSCYAILIRNKNLSYLEPSLADGLINQILN